MCIPLHRNLMAATRELKAATSALEKKRRKKLLKISDSYAALNVLKQSVEQCASNDMVELSMKSGVATQNEFRDASVDLFVECGVAMRNTVKAMDICLRV
jgi:hypothetical protein